MVDSLTPPLYTLLRQVISIKGLLLGITLWRCQSRLPVCWTPFCLYGCSPLSIIRLFIAWVDHLAQLEKPPHSPCMSDTKMPDRCCLIAPMDYCSGWASDAVRLAFPFALYAWHPNARQVLPNSSYSSLIWVYLLTRSYRLRCFPCMPNTLMPDRCRPSAHKDCCSGWPSDPNRQASPLALYARNLMYAWHPTARRVLPFWPTNYHPYAQGVLPFSSKPYRTLARVDPLYDYCSGRPFAAIRKASPFALYSRHPDARWVLPITSYSTLARVDPLTQSEITTELPCMPENLIALMSVARCFSGDQLNC